VSKTPIAPKLRRQVAQDARHRCGYCLCQEDVVGILMEVEHLKPEALGGWTARSNLWLACGDCNKRKGKRVRVTDPATGRSVRLFNPRKDKWGDHFRWLHGGLLVEGVSEIGRATVEALQLNLPPERVVARGRWIRAGWHPPRD
jgi:hypothetical protein